LVAKDGQSAYLCVSGRSTAISCVWLRLTSRVLASRLLVCRSTFHTAVTPCHSPPPRSPPARLPALSFREAPPCSVSSPLPCPACLWRSSVHVHSCYAAGEFGGGAGKCINRKVRLGNSLRSTLQQSHADTMVVGGGAGLKCKQRERLCKDGVTDGRQKLRSKTQRFNLEWFD
jgi:hypothetical protein